MERTWFNLLTGKLREFLERVRLNSVPCEKGGNMHCTHVKLFQVPEGDADRCKEPQLVNRFFEVCCICGYKRKYTYDGY